MAKTGLELLQDELARLRENKAAQASQAEPEADIAKETQENLNNTKNGGGGFGKGLLYTLEELGLGVVRSVEGVSDFVVGGVADLIGEDSYAESLMKNDWFNYGHAKEWYDPGAGMSFVGDVASGIGGMIPAVALSFIPVAGTALSTAAFGVGAAGQSASEAVKETGRLSGREWLYGAGSGALETGIEMLTGGIGGTKLAQGVTKNLAKTTAGKVGMNIIGEGLEEVASDIANPFLKRATGVDENASVDWENLPRTFAVGGVTGGLMGGATTAINSIADKGYNNYAAKVDAEQLSDWKSKANEQQANNEKIIYKQKDIAKIAENLSKRLQKMTDTAREQFLTRNANIAYMFNADGTMVEGVAVESKRKSRANLATPEGTAQGENTQATNTEVVGLDSESYNPDSYSVGLKGYEGQFAYKPVAVSSKASATSKNVMNTLTKLTQGKTNIVLTEDNLATADGSKVNGLYKDGIIYLDANATDYQKALSVGVHEVVHGLEGTKAYEKLAKFVAESISKDPALSGKYNAYRAAYDAILEGNYTETTKDYQATTEMFADFIANKVVSDKRTLNNLVNRDRNVVFKMLEWVRNAISKLGMSKEERAVRNELKTLEKLLSNALEEGRGGLSLEEVEKSAKAAEKAHLEDELKKKNAEAKAEAEETDETTEEKKNTVGKGKLATARYALSENAEQDVERALTDKFYGAEVKLTDTSPSILIAQKGVRDLPMIMKASHIRENVFTRDEAKAKGLSTNKGINYHGLGKELFLKVIGDLDSVTEAYRGTKNAENPARREKYFLLISKQTDSNGNVINVPVFTQEKGMYNRVSIDTNKIATVFGRDELQLYIREQIAKGNLVRIKKRNTQVGESTAPIAANYAKGVSTSIITEKDDLSSENAKKVEKTSTSRKSIDVEYANAIKNGNTAVAQKMVDKAAKEAGYDKKRFHETKEENIIHVFNLDLNTNASADYGTPFGVFTKSHNRSVGLGGKQMSLYVKADRTFGVKDRTETPKRLPQEYSTFVDKINAIDSEYDAKYEQLSDDLLFSFDDWLNENDPNDKMRNAWDISRNLEEQFGNALPKELIEKERKFLKVSDEWTNKTNQAILDAKKWLTKWLRDNGYDSMELEFDNGAGNRVTDALIVLDKEQVKSAEPATYDDNGNLIPLSKRFNKKSADIRYSLPVDVETDVKKHYGSTYNWKETGYILQDGTRLDLSGRNEGARGGYRQVDHRDIFAIFEDGDYSYGTEALIEFMGRGNIRVMPETPGINLQVEPNAEQYRLIQDFVERVGWKEGYFSVDIDNKNGDTIETLTYEGKPSGRKVVADLKYYFKEGKVPYKSNLSAFRYSIDVDADIADFPSIDKWFDALTAEELRELIDNDYTVEDISEELNVDTKKMRYLIRREGLGDSYVEDSKKAVMKQSRIDEAIDDSGASNPTYARDYITAISPKDFIDLTVRTDHVDRESFDREVIGDHGGIMSEWDYEKALQTSRSPYLQIDKATGRVIGHNGRHRIRALEKAGIQSVEIQVEFFDEDGRLIKYDSETIPKMAISSQFDTDIETTISKIIPLNESHRAEIEATYGEKATAKAGVRYALDADLVKKTSERVQTVVKGKEKKSVKETWDAIMEELRYGERARWIEVQIALTDEQAGIIKAAKNLDIDVNGEVQRARSAKSAALNMLAYKQTDFNGNVVGESLKDIFAPIHKKGGKYSQNFNEYLLHQLNIDRMSVVDRGLREEVAPVFEKDVTAAVSRERIAELEKQHPSFKSIAEKVWKYNQNLLQYRVDAGLITQAQADQMSKMYPHYVPSFYDTQTIAKTGASGGKSRIAVRTGVKAAKGSSGQSDIMDISLSISRQTESVVRAAAINKLVGKLYEKAVESKTFIDLDIAGQEKLTDPDVDYDEKIVKDNQILFYKGGERITLDVSEYMYAGFEGLGIYQKTINNPLLDGTAKWIGLWKKLVTSWNPLFNVSNAIKDFQEALFHTRYGSLKFVGRYFRSISRIASGKNSEYRKLWDTYVAMGGFQSGYHKGDIGVYDKRSDTRKKISKVLSFFEGVSEYIEQTPRFAEFVASVKAGNSYERALYDSADVTTNFSRGGQLTKKLNRTWIPFLNPAVQGWSKLYRTWVAPMDSMSEKQINKLSKTSKGRRLLSVYGQLIIKTLVLGIGAGMLNDLMYRWLDDDEEYKNLPLNIKENNYLIKVDDKFIKIPKTRIVALWGSISTRIIEYENGNKDALNAWDWFWSASEMVSPIETASRSVFAPIGDVIANRTWYGGEIESRTLEQKFEAKDRYDESTSSIAIAIGQALNFSPKKIHYLIDQYSGIIGDIFLPMTTQKAEQDMFSARFIVDPVYTNDISTKYYNLKDELNYAKSAKDLSAIMSLKYLNKSDDALSEIYQLKRDISNYNTLSADEKKSLISTLNDLGIDLSEKATLTDAEKRELTSILQALLNGSMATLTENINEFEQIVIDEDFAGEFSKLIYSDMYTGFNEETKNTAYNKAMNYYYGLYMSKLNGTKLDHKYVLYDAIGANETILYLAEISKITSDKDRNGDTITGSRKKKVQKYIQSLKLSAQQKNILLYLAGYKPTENGQASVRSYLLKNGYTAKEINELWN